MESLECGPLTKHFSFLDLGSLMVSLMAPSSAAMNLSTSNEWCTFSGNSNSFGDFLEIDDVSFLAIPLAFYS